MIDLTRISGLLSKGIETIAFGQVLADLGSLRRKLPISIRLHEVGADVQFVDREGRLLLFLDWILNSITEELQGETPEISLELRPEMNVFTIAIRWELPRDPARLESAFKNSFLWKVIEEDIPVVANEVTAAKITLDCHFRQPRDHNGLAEIAIGTFYSASFLDNEEENWAIAPRLHDLKNQILAFEQAMSKIALHNATEMLHARLQASKHLDAAASLINSLLSISNAMTEPTLIEADFGEFLHSYLATKIATLRKEIRIVTPKIGGTIDWRQS